MSQKTIDHKKTIKHKACHRLQQDIQQATKHIKTKACQNTQYNI